MACDCVCGQGLDYISGVRVPVHSVRAHAWHQSADHGDMIMPCTCTSRIGPCSFHSSATAVWNDLPSELKYNDISRTLFKSGLKTKLFEHVYSEQAPLRTLFKTRFTN